MQDAEEQQYTNFLGALCTQFATEGGELRSRQLAGIHIKNLLVAREQSLVDVKRKRWEACPDNIKHSAIASFLQALNSPHPNVSHTSAQVIAAYGAVEIPAKRFPELLETLCNNVQDAAVLERVKVSSLEAIGYMCEELDSDQVTEAQTNGILTAIIGGMQQTMPTDIRKAATEALSNTLDLAHENFERENERTMIMASIKTSATTCENPRVREEAYKCLHTVADCYYSLLKDYIMDIFAYSTNTIKTDEDDVGKMAIEFWTEVCEQELELQGLIEDEDEDAKKKFLNIMVGAFPRLLPIIMESTLTKQDEDADSDDYNVYQAGCNFISMLALTIGDKILEHDILIPFITGNFNSNDWRLQEASISVFGFIMEGCSDEKLHALIKQAMALLLEKTQSPNDHISLASFWTLAQICEFHTKAIDADQVTPIIRSVMAGLDRESSMLVESTCLVVINIATACEDQAELEQNMLSPFFMHLLQKVLMVAQRPDLLDTNAVHSLYEAAICMIVSGAQDVLQSVKEVLQESLNRLEMLINPNNPTPMGEQERQKLQGSLCNIIAECIRKAYKDEKITLDFADRMMQALLTMCKLTQSSTMSDTFDAIYAICSAMGMQFERYVVHVMPFLFAGLENYKDKQSCAKVIAIIGDLYRECSDNDDTQQQPSTQPHIMAQHSDDIVKSILTLLQSSDVSKIIKPQAISMLSDAALALKKDFFRYTELVMSMLDNASATQLSGDDDEEHDEFVWELREAILEVSSAVFISYREAKEQDRIFQCVSPIVSHSLNWNNEMGFTTEVRNKTVGVWGDIVEAYGAKIAPLFRQNQQVKDLISHCEVSDDEDLRATALWFTRLLAK